MNNTTEPLQPVTSVSELVEKAMRQWRYRRWMTLTVEAMGGDTGDLLEAKAWLVWMASQDEQAVLDMANHIREQV